MNIEEERKAFEEFALAKGFSIGKDFTGGYGTDVVRESWLSWIAAKEHAEEMSKPVRAPVALRICSDYHEEWFAYAHSWCGPRFDTEDKAVQWAKDNGYRVIE